MMSGIIIGDSPAMCRVRALIQRVAGTSLTVLVQGPTGSGKELVARALHEMSGRTGRLIAFNTCAIPDTMFEDALFGHVRGAFTGAVSDCPGYLTEAHRGTAFFDEIGSLPLSLQSKLLRVLETREFRPVGARTDRYSDFRVVSATNCELEALVSTGQFRADLAHRLGGIVIELPPLSERPEDIVPLARHFAAHAECISREPVALDENDLGGLCSYGWSGNVRELRHAVERAIALATKPLVSSTDILAAVHRRPATSMVTMSETQRAAARRSQLVELLERYAGDTAQVAAHLRVHRGTVYRRMEQLGISAPKRTSWRTLAPDIAASGTLKESTLHS